MVDNRVLLYYIAAMLSFIRVKPNPAAPGLLTLAHGGKPYRLEIVHVSREEHERKEREHAPNGEHRHDVYHLVLFTEGVNAFALNGREVPTRPGLLALTGPGDAHSFAPLRPGRTAYSELTFALKCGEKSLRLPFGEMLREYAGGELPETPAALPLSAAARGKMDALLGAIIDNLSRLPAGAWFRAYAAVADVLGVVAESLVAGVPARKEDDRLEAARLEIERRYRERLTLAELARKANLSPSHFVRRFKRAYGAAPIAYQLQLRVNAARTLLASTNLLCKEVALRCGFEDQYYFAKQFRRLAGVTAGEFRAGTEGR